MYPYGSRAAGIHGTSLYRAYHKHRTITKQKTEFHLGCYQKILSKPIRKLNHRKHNSSKESLQSFVI